MQQEHGNIKLDVQVLQQACFEIHRQGLRVTNQRLKDQLNGKGSAARIAKTVRWFNQEQLPLLNKSNATIDNQELALDLTNHTSAQPNQALSAVIAELEANFEIKINQIKADYAQKTQALKAEYEEKYKTLQEQAESFEIGQQHFEDEIRYLRKTDLGKTQVIERYADKLMAAEQQKTQLALEKQQFAEQVGKMQSQVMRLESDLMIEKERQNKLTSTISHAIEAKYKDQLSALNSNIESLQQQVKEANVIYERDTAYWMRRYSDIQAQNEESQAKMQKLNDQNTTRGIELQAAQWALREREIELSTLNKNMKAFSKTDQKLKLVLKLLSRLFSQSKYTRSN